MKALHKAHIRHLVLYPIKSAGGIAVSEALLTPSGLQVGTYRDHQFMVVRAAPDEDGVYHFITQRDKRNDEDVPQGLSILACIKPELVDGQLYLAWNFVTPPLVSR